MLEAAEEGGDVLDVDVVGSLEEATPGPRQCYTSERYDLIGTPHMQSAAETPATGTVELNVRLRCFVRSERVDLWVSGCPSLDVYSQGDTEQEAKSFLAEAVRLWVESCVERNTLEQALVELGWHRLVGSGLVPPNERDADLSAHLEPADSILGEPFPLEVRIPAFQAVALLTSTDSAP
ncbi:MAG TPA: hypothetical protein VF121_19460 [Thermoanaerobaculia bacterium]|nr:hypothetical protein [Thermoanaerobaculia bacterium]